MDIDLDISGHQSIQEELSELEDDWSDSPEFVIENDAEYSRFLELGTRKMQPYPFFRPALNEYMAGPNQLVQKNQGVDLSSADTIDELMLLIVVSINSQIEANLRAAASTGRSPGVHPEHPKVRTGKLLNSQSWKRVE